MSSSSSRPPNRTGSRAMSCSGSGSGGGRDSASLGEAISSSMGTFTTTTAPLMDDDDTGSQTKRTERKRQREKQRRSDLSGAFDELGTLLGDLESDVFRDVPSPTTDTSGGSAGTGSGSVNTGPATLVRKRSMGESDHNTDPDTGGMTRLDLILRAVSVLKALKSQNDSLRQSIASLQHHRTAHTGSNIGSGGIRHPDDEVRTRKSHRFTCCSSFSNSVIRC
jgi:hypothetical protein